MPEVHVASLIVQTRPEAMERTLEAIRAIPEAEVHAADGGRIIVVLETPSTAALAEHSTALHLLPDVYSASLVYHAVTDEDAAEPDIPVGELPCP